jgi:hypothetical protein
MQFGTWAEVSANTSPHRPSLAFMHHAVDISDHATVERFAHHGVQLFLRIVKRRGTVTTKKELAERVDRMKLSGGGPTNGHFSLS